MQILMERKNVQKIVKVRSVPKHLNAFRARTWLTLLKIWIQLFLQKHIVLSLEMLCEIKIKPIRQLHHAQIERYEVSILHDPVSLTLRILIFRRLHLKIPLPINRITFFLIVANHALSIFSREIKLGPWPRHLRKNWPLKCVKYRRFFFIWSASLILLILCDLRLKFANAFAIKSLKRSLKQRTVRLRDTDLRMRDSNSVSSRKIQSTKCPGQNLGVKCLYT